MKHCLFVLVLLHTATSNAQNSSLKFSQLKPELFATTGIGVSFLNPSFKKISNNGFKTYTGMEIQFMNQYWARLSYEISLYGFSNASVQDGFKVTTKGISTFIGGFIDLGYRKEFHDFAIYGFGGFGVGRLNAPNTRLSTITLEVNSEPLNKVHLALRAGIGIELEIKPRFIPFVEYQYSGLMERTKVEDRKMAFSNILFGVKARIKRKK